MVSLKGFWVEGIEYRLETIKTYGKLPSLYVIVFIRHFPRTTEQNRFIFGVSLAGNVF